jgi:hypothetical protein
MAKIRMSDNTMSMVNRKSTNNDVWNTTQKNKDGATWTTLKPVKVVWLLLYLLKFS